MTTSATPRRPSPTPDEPARRAPAARVVVGWLFRAATPEFYLLLGTTLFLLIFGLVMVLSSSSIESRVNDGDFFSRASRQAIVAVVGVPLMLLAARAPLRFWRTWAGRALVIALVLQLLIFSPLKYGYGGNTNWIQIGSFTAQPSETIKFSLVLWLAAVLSGRLDRLHEPRQLLLPIVPVVLLAVGLVLGGNDLGTASIILLLTFGALFVAGAPLRYLLLGAVGLGLAAAVMVTSSDSRSGRFSAWLSGCVDQELLGDECWQTVHGWEALAHGGLSGVGLGNSAGKWSWIPEADNDFIFAIIGEELGLVGAVLVLLLFVVLAIALVRIARMVVDPFARIATGAVLVWVVGQAFVNIAVVLGLLPVLGVPLPLVSSGGSALLTTLAAIGVVLSFARERPIAAPPIAPRRGSGRIVR